MAVATGASPAPARAGLASRAAPRIAAQSARCRAFMVVLPSQRRAQARLADGGRGGRLAGCALELERAAVRVADALAVLRVALRRDGGIGRVDCRRAGRQLEVG